MKGNDRHTLQNGRISKASKQYSDGCWICGRLNHRSKNSWYRPYKLAKKGFSLIEEEVLVAEVKVRIFQRRKEVFHLDRDLIRILHHLTFNSRSMRVSANGAPSRRMEILALVVNNLLKLRNAIRVTIR